MDWSNEHYVRIYTRDSKTWLKLGWEGQCCLTLFWRKLDQCGVYDSVDDPVEDVALATGLPLEVAAIGVPRLLKLGVLELHGGKLIAPNYLEAQFAQKSDKQRAKEYRERRRMRLMSNTHENVTNRDESITLCDASSREPMAVYENVTQCSTVQCNTVQLVSDACDEHVVTNAHPKGRAKRSGSGLTKPPDDLEPSAATLQVAKDTGRDWRQDWQACRDWAESNGKLKHDWQATLRGWMRRSAEQHGRSQPVSGVQEVRRPEHKSTADVEREAAETRRREHERERRLGERVQPVAAIVPLASVREIPKVTARASPTPEELEERRRKAREGLAALEVQS